MAQDTGTRDIEQDLELCEKASKGPWEVKTNAHRNTDGTLWGWVVGPRENWCWSKSRNKSYEDAAFIAAARTALPWYIGEARRLREENARLIEALADKDAREQAKKALEVCADG